MSAENENAASHAMAKLKAKVNPLNALLSFSVNERERGQREAAELRQQIVELHRQIDELRRQIDEADRQHRASDKERLNEIEGLRQELAALLGSTSWRLSAPIRIIGRWLKGRD
jgi:hypothetical protein